MTGLRCILWDSRSAARLDRCDGLGQLDGTGARQVIVQTRHRISPRERQGSLRNDVAAVDSGVEPVHGRPGLPVVGVVRPEEGISTAVARQQGGVEVDAGMGEKGGGKNDRKGSDDSQFDLALRKRLSDPIGGILHALHSELPRRCPKRRRSEESEGPLQPVAAAEGPCRLDDDLDVVPLRHPTQGSGRERAPRSEKGNAHMAIIKRSATLLT